MNKFFIKVNSDNEIYQAMKVPFNNAIEVETDISFDEIVGYSYINNKVTHNLKSYKREKIQELESDFNAAKKITIQNGNTLEIAYDTPERDKFLELIEVVSKLRPIQAVEYAQGGLGFRILSEIATYIFKDLFTATLTNGTEVNARKRNKTIIYNNAVAQINNAKSITDLDAITWTFVNPTGILIDVSVEAAKMLNDATVSQFAKDAINAAKDPATGEIHLVKTLQELADDS